jgi:hypothetical protein
MNIDFNSKRRPTMRRILWIIADYLRCLLFGGCPCCCDTMPEMTDDEARALLVADVTAHMEVGR